MLCLLKFDSSDEVFTEKIREAERRIFHTDRPKRGNEATLFARVLLGYMLKKKYDINSFSYFYGEKGKPYLENESIFFSISHSGEYVLCCLSEKEVGCDIERIKDFNPKIAERFFTEKEKSLLDEGGKELFTRFWTLKESELKKDGTGIGGGLKNYCFADFAGKGEFSAYGCNFFTFSSDGYLISVCTQEENEGLQTVSEKEITEYINNLI